MLDCYLKLIEGQFSNIVVRHKDGQKYFATLLELDFNVRKYVDSSIRLAPLRVIS